ncbi:MAG: hypothetical protein EOO45_19580 [Flavobacterium sp.]|nr:MAG: hypothetical protein EOO45_19580 [Flavobacterium sp.]
MKLSEIKMILPQLDNVAFQFENGQSVPEHFHVTEVGIIDRYAIDDDQWIVLASRGSLNAPWQQAQHDPVAAVFL